MSLLCGCFGLYLATLGLFALGISITPWHGLAFLIPAWGGGLLATPQPGRFRKASLLLLLVVLLCGLFAGIASRFDDLSWDGMASRMETVLALASGWNPSTDPSLQDSLRLAEKTPYFHGSLGALSGYQYSFGNILAAYLAKLTGNLNSGKAVTPILMIASLGMAFGAFQAVGLSRTWSSLLALLVALNPVSIYQSSSYYIDGHIAPLFASLVCSGLRLLVAPLKADGVLALGASFLALSAAKTSGLFYGIIADLFFLGFFVVLRMRRRREIMLFLLIAALLTWPAGWVIRNVAGFPGLSMNYLTSVTKTSTEGYGVGSGSYAPNEYLGKSKIENFFLSHFAPTEVMSETVKTKFPFWFNRRELALFEDLSPDPRAGGFGPLYGAFLILTGISAGLLMNQPRPPTAAWFPILPTVIGVLLSQPWWARWVPQAWLIPVFLLLPVLATPHGLAGCRTILPSLALGAGLLNSLLILIFYSVGCWRNQAVLKSQIEFLRHQPLPLQIYTRTFPSNRIWLIRENIPFVVRKEEPARPRLKLNRTDTKVALSPDWEKNANPESRRLWQKRNLVEP